MNDNVIQFPTVANAAECLRNIANENPDDVFVIAWPKDNKEPITYHSTTDNIEVVVFRIQQFLHELYNGKFGEI